MLGRHECSLGLLVDVGRGLWERRNYFAEKQKLNCCGRNYFAEFAKNGRWHRNCLIVSFEVIG
jgi:hypothetical protein